MKSFIKRNRITLLVYIVTLLIEIILFIIFYFTKLPHSKVTYFFFALFLSSPLYFWFKWRAFKNRKNRENIYASKNNSSVKNFENIKSKEEVLNKKSRETFEKISISFIFIVLAIALIFISENI